MNTRLIFGLPRWTLAVAAIGALATGGLAAQEMSHGMAAMHGSHEEMAAHLDKMLAMADATPDQKARIHQIMSAAMHELAPIKQQAEDQHAAMHRLFMAPTIDRNAIEQARAQHIAAADQMSRILAKALADSAEVLTPEQRAKIAASMTAKH
jgi:Spy/CpxP family protein refolding chaperone